MFSQPLLAWRCEHDYSPKFTKLKLLMDYKKRIPSNSQKQSYKIEMLLHFSALLELKNTWFSKSVYKRHLNHRCLIW